VVLTQVAPPHPPLAAGCAEASPRDPLGSEHYQGVRRSSPLHYGRLTSKNVNR
jgi:hypothetical protein